MPKSILVSVWIIAIYFSVQNCSSLYISDINSTDITTEDMYEETSDTWTPCLDDTKEVHPAHKYSFFVRVVGFGISCGGSLITKQYILSAAQCLPKYAKKDENGRIDYDTVQGFVVYVGVFNMTDEQNAYPVEAIAQFPGYENNLNADILLIKLFTTVDHSEGIRPINLPYDPRLEIPGVAATVTGWNLTAEGNCSANEALKEAKLMILLPTICHEYYDVSQFTFCAGYPVEGACLGDIGGPVFVEKNNNYYIIGMVSIPGTCAMKPGRYTKVSMFNTWIERNMGKLKYT